MIYIIHKMLALIKNHQNYLKDNIFEYFCNEYNRLSLFLKKIFFFFTTYVDGKFKSLRRRHN